MKQIPFNACKCLPNISSTKESFDIAAPPIKKALKILRFDTYLGKINGNPKDFNPKDDCFCNLPLNKAIKNNDGKKFQPLVDYSESISQDKQLKEWPVKKCILSPG